MEISRVREILGEAGSKLTDTQIEELLALYRAIARVFISKHQKNKLKNAKE